MEPTAPEGITSRSDAVRAVWRESCPIASKLMSASVDIWA